ncbi:MAG: hypothetical protein MUD08_06915, partial [Cytophagales bacterium]|nr:hypothetical protein [Cytophagales bacterium]
MKRVLCNLIIAACVFAVAINTGQAQTRYWRGGTGSWNSAANWSTTSGGVGGASVPSATDAVVFDANSFTAAGQTVTVTAGATCASMDWTGVTNTPTLSLANPLAITG